MGTTREVNLEGECYLSDEHWELIREYLPEPPSNPKGGRPRHGNREVLEGILFVLLTGCQWEKLPKSYPSPSTCWRRFDLWTCTGLFQRIWEILLADLDFRGSIDWTDTFGDAWFVRAKKGVTEWEKPSVERVPRFRISSIRTGPLSPFI